MQLVGCAIELIAEVGYGLASLSKIAERAGVAKSVVLYHFAGKEELLNTLVMETFLASVPYTVPPVRAEGTAQGVPSTEGSRGRGTRVRPAPARSRAPRGAVAAGARGASVTA